MPSPQATRRGRRRGGWGSAWFKGRRPSAPAALKAMGASPADDEVTVVGFDNGVGLVAVGHDRNADEVRHVLELRLEMLGVVRARVDCFWQPGVERAADVQEDGVPVEEPAALGLTKAANLPGGRPDVFENFVLHSGFEGEEDAGRRVAEAR